MFSAEDSVEILQQFPPVVYAFAYGSGVVTQGGYDYSKPSSQLPMLDLVFVVEDSEAWHQNNMEMNPHHYTPLIPQTAASIAYIQDRIGAGMWYNVGIPMNISKFPDRPMKYGVISKATLIDDLTKWSCLYAAGRLHKPVCVLKSCPVIEGILEQNRASAIRASLLLLPSSFKETELFMSVASLSYIGDPRMIAGENPKKVWSHAVSMHAEFLLILIARIPFLSFRL